VKERQISWPARDVNPVGKGGVYLPLRRVLRLGKDIKLLDALLARERRHCSLSDGGHSGSALSESSLPW